MRTSLGIDSVAQQVYLAMVAEPRADVHKLAERLDRRPESVEEALGQLAGLDLIAPGDGATGWLPVEPEVGLPAMLARQQAELAQRQQQFEDSRLAVAQLLATHGRRTQGQVPGVEWVSGEAALWRRVAELAEDCRQEVLTLGPTERLTDSVLEAARALDETVLRRGVRSRAVLLESTRNDNSAMPYLRWKTDTLGGVRTLPSLPVWMILIDRQHLVVPVSTFRSVLGGLVCTAESMVNAFAALFATHWREAIALTEARPRTGGHLSLQEQHILRLWAQGLTDASAARQMDVSLRTVRRLSDRLTDRFGAHSRFQLGAMAIAEGSIRAEDMI
ncbi:helix-turn-helix domain-containing protein [Kitasatospora sp. GAS204B]|uniref:helix-turn-helix domain-containing protein n=1 Tax=unclassified Kitasatospora TaxID=2633591 RepID=UPI002473CE20|nr:helix-turn-helix domain-containing protein [Kitasatospora sp. GAS204B]MDH6122685.1 DNA-binding CsgD family transcriptional regulator [Kitasatospora sp. GAS204B]